MIDFSEWFVKVTRKGKEPGKLPFPYQKRLATSPELPNLLNVPTGAGKTAAAVLSWLWRRHEADEAIRDNTPRRLVYCLPMRTLVEQTYAEVERWRNNAELEDKVELHLLMGGAVSNRWDAHPEKDCILIGTQDQLLSRALNRGYGINRYRWPIHFALLNNDCLWVIDEVQLMGSGLRTTAQLQWFRQIFDTYGITHSLWMSATLDEQLLQTVDYYNPKAIKLTHQGLTEEDLADQTLKKRVNAHKQLVKANIILPTKEKEDYARKLAEEVVKAHIPGTLTIVICNRVKRAQAVFQKLQALEKEGKIEDKLSLIHSRFRSGDRQAVNKQLLSGNLIGILVATQAIEAGVDISAMRLFTELAPWSSIVQRVGRCNRTGDDTEATVYWIDIETISKEAASPYEVEDLEETQKLLQKLTDEKGEIGPAALNEFEANLKPEERPKTKTKGLIPRQHDLLQLFDTSTDLAGHNIDISSFIRETDDSDVALAWRHWEGDKPPDSPSQPDYNGALQQQELCRVSISQAKEFLKKQKFWTWDGLLENWQQLKVQEIYPGISLLLHISASGYSQELGFTGENERKPIQPIHIAPTERIEPNKNDSDLLSQGAKDFVSLKVHSQDVFEEAQKLCKKLSEFNLPTQIIERAARWHDAGKVHPHFQEMLTYNRPEKVAVDVWAKSNHDYTKPEDRYQPPKELGKSRRGFRHELVSAILALQQGEEFLLVYLIACHHGKVRLTIQPKPYERAPTGVKLYALGVHENDQIPEIDLGEDVQIETQKLSLKYMLLGDDDELGESWVARASTLLDEYGPFKLAFLETLIRVADWQGSAKRAQQILEKTDGD